MSVNISHDDALRIASRVGALMHKLYGPPKLVVGIERGGTAVAAAFAKASQADSCALIRQQRPTSTGWRGWAREFLQITTPLALRKLYRKLLFKTVIHTSRQIRPEVLELDEVAKTKLEATVCDIQDGLLVVVGDAIDSGGTAARVLAALGESAPRARVILFTLTSTVGARVADQQINAFADILEYEEGDISELGDAHRESAEWSALPRETSDTVIDEQVMRSLYLDLDGTLVMDSFRCARNTLLKYLFRNHLFWSATRLLTITTIKKLRVIGHRSIKTVVDDLIHSLSPKQNDAFQSLLSKALDQDSRWTLAALSSAPYVRSRIVTAALASYAQAIEEAFGIPVLIASGRGQDGAWLEVDSQTKVAAIRADFDAAGLSEAPALFVGDTLMDALSTTDGVPIAIVPKWDTTGLLTILAAESWWSAEE